MDLLERPEQANEGLRERFARQAQRSVSAKTFVVAEEEGRAAGYFSLTVGQVDTLEAPERIRKGMGQYPLPVVILARLAVSKGDRGRGTGLGLLRDAIRRTMLIAEQASIRALLAHPIGEEAARLCTRFGFIASLRREQQLLLLLKDARRWVVWATTNRIAARFYPTCPSSQPPRFSGQFNNRNAVSALPKQTPPHPTPSSPATPPASYLSIPETRG